MSHAARALELLLAGEGTAARFSLDRAREANPDRAERARLLAVASFVHLVEGRFIDAVETVDAALELVRGDADLAAVPATAAAFVHCYATLAVTGLDPAESVARVIALRDRILGLEGDDATIAGYLAIEAAMAAGQLRAAQEFGESYRTRSVPGQTGVVGLIALARSYAFQGMLDPAHAAATVAADLARGVPTRSLANATLAYLAAQSEERAETERLTALVEAEGDRATMYTVGAHVLCAYALSAVENVGRAATMILWAGGSPSLSRLQVVDRAYGYELLTADAIERGDLTAARSWGRRAMPLGGNDMAVAAVARTLSRLDAAIGRADTAAEHAAVAAARALVAGGRLDAARSAVLLASAHAAAGSTDRAVSELRTVALEAQNLGAVAVRNWSARELSRLGRHLPSHDDAWSSLSEREQQVALLAAEGFSNRAIGHALFLSERTVQGYLSRALAALGVGSRAALPASLGRSPGVGTLTELTARQEQVAILVAAGYSNRTISSRLSISEKTVEKHIVAIFARLHVTSRTGIANHVLSHRPETRPA